MAEKQRLTFQEFWPYYVMAHQQPMTRFFHFLATLAELSLLLYVASTGRLAVLLIIPVVSYGLAWYSHFFIERNKPATFGHPFYSWVADHKMFALTLRGRMAAEVDRIRQTKNKLGVAV